MLKGTGGCVGCGVGRATIILKMEKRNATHSRQSTWGFYCRNDTSSSELETGALTKKIQRFGKHTCKLKTKKACVQFKDPDRIRIGFGAIYR